MKRLALLVTLATACGGSVGPKFNGNVRVADSRLVAINPDVKTVTDADQPVFFARGSYWLFHDGEWFRAQRPNGPWAFVAKPPVPVLQIDQPYAYVHYRKDGAGKEIETVAAGFQASEGSEADPERRPARDRQPTAVDPSVDPAVNLAPAR